ncbi:hypothetical protein H6761_01570 [Candidatus Nomurabacteria bacterium]|nr:hypothetical protein [Candidatus Nomurabacteria bacterium]
MLGQLAQTNEVLENLVNSETKMQELNQRLGDLKMEYELMTRDSGNMSFFNFENIYFWFVVCGLLILAFALWFLWLELKDKKVKPEKIKKDGKENKKIAEFAPLPLEKKHKVYKVKVRKK